MTDQPYHHETSDDLGSDDPGMEYDRESRADIPRWVKVVGIVVAILALLVVIMLVLNGGGGHGPSRHS